MKVLWFGEMYQKPDYCCEALEKFSESGMVNFQPEGLYLEQKPDRLFKVVYRKGKGWGIGAFITAVGLLISLWVIFVALTEQYYWQKDLETIFFESRLEQNLTLLWIFQDLKINNILKPRLIDLVLIDVILWVLGLGLMIMISYRKPKVQEYTDPKKNPGKEFKRWGRMSHCPFCGEQIGTVEGEARPAVAEVMVEEEAEQVSAPQRE